MKFASKRTYGKNEVTTWSVPNYWDILAIVIICTVIVLVAFGAKQMSASYRLGDLIPLSLSPYNLPNYAIRTTLRLFIGLFFSLVFTLIFGPMAAKNEHAERIIIPTIDILQSVPVLSFLTITSSGFIYLFRGSMLGPECAAIFGIFTSQVWNMVLSFYQSVKIVPRELGEVASTFQLSPWRRFWRIEVPFAMPGLLWNMMMSMSGSWFFVIACEAFSVSGSTITLPGIGSYIWLAISQANKLAIIHAIICMLVVIFLYDQILFRPLICWTEKFRDQIADEEKIPKSWLVSLFRKTVFLQSIILVISKFIDGLINLRVFNSKALSANEKPLSKILIKINYLILIGFILYISFIVWKSVLTKLSFAEIKHVFFLGILTGIRVLSLIFISSLLWLPVGVWIGLRPSLSTVVQPIIQFAAAFPANLLFPLATLLIIKFNLNVEIWVAPLMVLGTQWYILFNVIAGTSQIPNELQLAASNLQLKGILWWRKFILPAVGPSFVTGAITAAGGAWNASIVAEVISWGQIELSATGIGAYIKESSESGDFLRVALGTIVMCLIVLLINRLFWKPLYNITMNKISES